MNKHFEDARYYIKRAGETAKQGVKEELEPIEERFRKLTSKEEPEEEASKLEEIRAELEELQEKAEGEAKEAIADAREKIQQYRKKEA